MKRTLISALVSLPLLALIGLAFAPAATGAESGGAPVWAANPPKGFIPPPLNPAGIQLQTKQLAPGVYALLSGHPAVDNSGFVVGERGVLVIDAHINGAMARQIQAAVREITDKPILYLVNTNYHGDHTFGNYAFPAETRIIAHRETAARMADIEHEKQLMLRTVENDPSVFADVRLRLPDVVFDDFLRLDLGGRQVTLHHFGAGNTPGDTVVYLPEARVAWTGNLVLGDGTIPPMFEGGAARYLRTIGRFAETLAVDTIIPGHGAPATGAILGRYLGYLSALVQSVRRAAAAGAPLDETLTNNPLEARYLPPADSPAAALGPFLAGLHQLNVQQTYYEVNGH
jgi:cyclase